MAIINTPVTRSIMVTANNPTAENCFIVKSCCSVKNCSTARSSVTRNSKASKAISKVVIIATSCSKRTTTFLVVFIVIAVHQNLSFFSSI
jgi:hypothetical protein